jgi:hypothetical protein
MNEILSTAFAGGLVGFALATLLQLLHQIIQATLAARRRRRWIKSHRIIRPGIL